MGFRFFRRKKLFPGVTLNISRSGPSISLGPRGAKVTIGPKGTRKTVGIPGTGLFYTETSSKKAEHTPQPLPGPAGSPSSPWGAVFVIGIIIFLIYFFVRAFSR